MDAIERKGKIGSIYYRANGIVNVNYSNAVTGGTMYHNVTLRLKGGKLSYYGNHPYDIGFGGTYKKRGGGTKVSYPKNVPALIR